MSCAMPAVNAPWSGPKPREIALGSIDQIPPGQGRCFKVGAMKIAIFRQRDDSVFALDNRCPHQGGPLADGLVGASVVVCPLHGYRFQLSDGAGIDNELAVRSHRVEVRNGSIFIQRVEQA